MSRLPRPVAYPDYLGLDRIFSAQRPPDALSEDPGARRDLLHHDELLFIVMHQTMELWFKVVVSELETARDRLSPALTGSAIPERDVPKTCEAIRRSAKVLEHLTQQFSLIETMRPIDFLAFRDALMPASGFQSYMFRDLEMLAGLRDEDRIEFEGKPYYAEMSAEKRADVAARRAQPSFRDALFSWLARCPIEKAFPDFLAVFLNSWDAYADEQRTLQAANPNLGGEQVKAAGQRIEASKRAARDFLDPRDQEEKRAHVAFLFIATFRDEPLLSWPWALLEAVLEFEEFFRIFRFRHARMAERAIGRRVGTGGSAGVAYLDAAAQRYRIFGELLDATSFLIDRRRLPAIPNPAYLDFAAS